MQGHWGRRALPNLRHYARLTKATLFEPTLAYDAADLGRDDARTQLRWGGGVSGAGIAEDRDDTVHSDRGFHPDDVLNGTCARAVAEWTVGEPTPRLRWRLNLGGRFRVDAIHMTGRGVTVPVPRADGTYRSSPDMRLQGPDFNASDWADAGWASQQVARGLTSNSSVLGRLETTKLPWGATSQYIIDSGGVERGPFPKLGNALIPTGPLPGHHEKAVRGLVQPIEF